LNGEVTVAIVPFAQLATFAQSLVSGHVTTRGRWSLAATSNG